jgi:hypothetical protein
MVAGAGENFLIAAIDDRTNPVNVQSQILAVAKMIGESM